MKNYTATVHYYSFDTTQPAEYDAYNKLHAELRAKGLKCFNVMAGQHTKAGREYPQKCQALDGQTVTIETKHLFDDQFNTADLRLHHWYEGIYPNRSHKRGYWCELSQDYLDLLAATYKCGYCGALYGPEHEPIPVDNICHNCFTSEYLKPENFPLLHLKPMAGEPLPEPEDMLEYIRTHWRIAQGIGKDNKVGKMREKYSKNFADKIADLDFKKIEEEQIYELRMRLLDHNLADNLDNIISYKKYEITIGWRRSLDDSAREEIRKSLKDWQGWDVKFK